MKQKVTPLSGFPCQLSIFLLVAETKHLEVVFDFDTSLSLAQLALNIHPESDHLLPYHHLALSLSSLLWIFIDLAF